MSVGSAGGSASPGETWHRGGSHLLLRKLSLLSTARASVQQNPADSNAECNLLCFGPDVYRIRSLILNKNGNSVLPVRRWRRQPCEKETVERIEKEDEQGVTDNLVGLPTHMGFMSLLLTELQMSSAKMQESKKGEEADAKGLLKKRKKEVERKAPQGRHETESSDGDYAESEGVDGGGALRSGDECFGVKCLQEERALLRAIRLPLSTVRDTPVLDEAGSGSKTRHNVENRKEIISNPTNRIAWEHMLEFLMTCDTAVDGNDEGVRSYLRRVAWIEQQKKLQSVDGEGSGTLYRGEQQSWVTLTEAMRVQKEILRMRAQRKRFRRPQKGGKE